MKFTRQFDQMDCGPACIRMVASAYGKDYPLSYLRSLSHLTREGVSVAGIRDALDKIGANSATFEMTTEQLREKCPLPAILHWEQNHFVVLYDIKLNKWTGKWKYYVANPAYGKHAFNVETFSHFWLNGNKGVVIAIEPREEFLRKTGEREAQPCPFCSEICVAFPLGTLSVGVRYAVRHALVAYHAVPHPGDGG